VQAYDNYVEDGVDPVQHRERSSPSSHFKGVSWHKGSGKWRAVCKNKHLGQHVTEEGAAQAYNIEAERLGLPLNVIPLAGDAHPDVGSHTAAPAAALAVPRPAAHAHAGAAPKRAASTSLASPHTKLIRLDTSAGVVGARAAGEAAALRAELEARIINEEDEGEEVEDSYEEAEETQAGEEEGEGRREQHAQAPDASLDGRLEVGAGAAAAAQGAALQARIKVSKAKAEVADLNAKVAELHAKAAEVDTALAEAQLAVHAAEQEAAEAERTAAQAALNA